MGQFKPMPKMETTEPSVELKLKKGGKVKKMMDGGVPMAMAAPAAMGRRMPAGRQAVMPRGVSPLARAGMPMRKSGGHIGNEKAELRRVKAEMAEDRREERNEHEEIGRVKGELKRHEGMKASKAHKGLKKGGMAPKAGPNVVGGLEGGLEATRIDRKKTTGNIELSKYKRGGAIAAKGMAIAKKYMTTTNTGNPMPTVKGGTGKVSNTSAGGRPAGFKKGGAIAAKGIATAKKYMTKTNSAANVKPVKGGTGGIEGSKFKSGGHVAMTCKSTGGFTAMKKMQKC
jgi:hypothetical protein